ncbi:MAG: AEC family transporter [Deinococcota bacterium]
MDAFWTAVNAVVPTFVLIVIGAVADRAFPNLNIETLTRLSVQVLIPALIFNALMNTSVSLAEASLLTLGYVIYLVVLGVLSLMLGRGLNGTQRRGMVVSSLFGNTGNMGLPVTLFAYGQAGFERAVILLVISLMLMFVLGPALLAGDARDGRVLSNILKRLKAALLLPPIWATAAGLAFNGLDWTLPVGLARGVELLADGTIAVMLLSLGMQTRRSWRWGADAVSQRAGALRLAIGPVIAYGASLLLGLSVLDRNVLVLSAAMPTAVTMFVVAVEVGGDREGVARAVVVTTVGSILAISAVIMLLPS